jgi:hypothetical protein
MRTRRSLILILLLAITLPGPVARSGTGGSGRLQTYVDVKDVSSNSVNDLIIGLTSAVQPKDAYGLYPGLGLYIKADGGITISRLRSGARRIKKGEFHVVQEVLASKAVRTTSTSNPWIRTTTTCTGACTAAANPTYSNLCEARYPLPDHGFLERV